MIVALLLLSGCWPLIPGDYVDYTDGDTDDDTGAPAPDELTRVFGAVTWNDFVGGYWDDSAGQGVAFAQSLAEPTDGYTAWDLGYTRDGCLAEADATWLAPAAGAAEDDRITLGGDPDIRIGFEAQYGLYYADLTAEPSGDYDLEPFDGDGNTYAASTAVRMPGRLDYDDSLITGDALQSAPLDDLDRFRWTPRDNAGLYAVVGVRVVRDDGVVSEVVCAAPASAGEIDVDVGALSQTSRADYFVVALGSGYETAVKLDGSDEWSRFIVVKQDIGAVTPE